MFPARTALRPPISATPSPQQGAILKAAEQVFGSAQQLESQGNVLCVDHYTQTAATVWPLFRADLVQGADVPSGRAAQLYHAAVTRLLVASQEFGRLDLPGGRLQNGNGATRDVIYHGFPWQPLEFGQIVPVGEYASPELRQLHKRPGVGVPVVVTASAAASHDFVHAEQPFAATVVWRPGKDSAAGLSCINTAGKLEFYDPLRVSAMDIAGCSVPLRGDISAPFAYAIHRHLGHGVGGFFEPGVAEVDAGLYFLEPYQAGKIPLVLVHGLASDRLTWSSLVNDLYAEPDFRRSYQVWAYQYATGKPFLSAAARLRSELRQARRELDPARGDRALDRMVLVGHSMGGLVCKLQVIYGGSELWDSIARRPLHEIRGDPETLGLLRESFFFTPVDSVQRVVFMGTPHRGSSWARRFVGRLAGSLVREPAAQNYRYQSMVLSNPGVFAPQVRRRIPTSIDLLEPTSPLLNALADARVSPGTPSHSIIGTGRSMVGSGPADGVVPVSSARTPGVQSELFIDTLHEKIHSHPDSVAELLRILGLHVGTPPVSREGLRSRSRVPGTIQ